MLQAASEFEETLRDNLPKGVTVRVEACTKDTYDVTATLRLSAIIPIGKDSISSYRVAVDTSHLLTDALKGLAEDFLLASSKQPANR